MMRVPILPVRAKKVNRLILKNVIIPRLQVSSRKRRGNVVNFDVKREIGILATVLAVSLLVRLLLFPLQGYPVDINDFLSWFNTAATHGIRPFYSDTGWTDYPPFNVYIFWFFGSIANAASKAGISAVNIVKLAPNLFDLGTAVLIYVFVRKQASFKLAIAATALYTFNPAVIYDAAVWGQYDAIYTFFLVLSLMLALRKKPMFSAAAFALGILTKPQGIALAPLVAFLIYKKNGLREMLASVLAFAATVFVVILPFNWGGSPISFLTNIYFVAYKGYAYTSINAFNLWGLISGMWVPDGNLLIVGWALFGAFTAFTLYFLNKRFKTSSEFLAVYAAFMLLFAFFMLPTRIHERYLFPAISVLALMYPFVAKARPFYAVLTATLFINEAYVLYWLNAYYPKAGPNLTGDPVVLTVSAINLLMLFYASIVMWDKRTWLKSEPPPPSQAIERGEPA
jgi:Gpi18-like mannosyltransferase